VTEGRSFTFVLVPNHATELQQYASLWNHLIRYCPIFPTTTLFYNHLSDEIHDRISSKVNSDLYVHLFSFGNLDDELNQLNNARHNFRAGIPLIGKPKKKECHIPVCIVGSGPSLDDRIDDLKAIKDDVIIISSGTALRSLWKHGIKPDFQVELESDFNTYATQSLMEDKEYMASIKILGAAQLNPLIFSLFGDARLFFKDDGPLAYWFGRESCVIPNATPTCTNAALAIALFFEFPQIYLFGLDYGFPDKERHHASGAVYYKDEMKDSYQVDSSSLINIPCAAGGQIQTTSFLYTSKRRIDNLLYSKGAVEVINCSNGAVIEHTQWLAPGQVLMNLREKSVSKSSAIKALLGKKKNIVDVRQVKKQKNECLKDLETFVKQLDDWFAGSAFNKRRDFLQLCSWCVELFSKLESDNKGFYFLIRGSIWHFLLAGYTMVMASEDKNVTNLLTYWKRCLSGYLSALPCYIGQILTEKRGLQDDLFVNQSIWQPDPKEFELCCYDWEALDVVINDEFMFVEPISQS
jgi:hypothetical protein